MKKTQYVFVISLSLALAISLDSQNMPTLHVDLSESEKNTTFNTTSYTKKTFTFKVVDGHEIKADVYRVQDSTIRPAILWIHGGSLVAGTREWINPEQLQLYISSGYTVISIDYRLAPESKLSAMIEDIEDAYSWIRAHSAKLSIDPGRIAVSGQSAGAYLSLIAGYHLEPRPAAVVALYGYADIHAPWSVDPDSFYNKQFDEPLSITREQAFSYVGKATVTNTPWNPRGDFYKYCRQEGIFAEVVTGHDPKEEPEWFLATSPRQHFSPSYPPTMLLHGEKDKDIPFEHAVLLSETLKREGIEHQFITNPEWGHVFDRAGFADPDVKQAFEGIISFLDQHLN